MATETQRILKVYDPAEPVIFVHVPKCAGTSFIRLLRRWYGPTYHHPHQDETKDILIPKVATRLASGEFDPQVKVIHAHWDHGRGYGLPYYCPEVTQYFTIARDPFDMIVSMYFFVKGKCERGEFRYRGEVQDLRELYPSVDHYLDAEQGWVQNHLPIDMSCDNLSDYVARRFVYLGWFEQMETSIDHLAFVLGQKRQILPRHNVSRYDEQVPEHRRSEIHERYPIMKRLYDHAQRTFEVPSFERSKILPALPEPGKPKAGLFGRTARARSQATARSAGQPATESKSAWWKFWR